MFQSVRSSYQWILVSNVSIRKKFLSVDFSNVSIRKKFLSVDFSNVSIRKKFLSVDFSNDANQPPNTGVTNGQDNFYALWQGIPLSSLSLCINLPYYKPCKSQRLIFCVRRLPGVKCHLEEL